MNNIYLSIKQDYLLLKIKRGFELKHKNINYDCKRLINYELISPSAYELDNTGIPLAVDDNDIYIITEKGIMYLDYTFKNFINLSLFNFVTITISIMSFLIAIFK